MSKIPGPKGRNPLLDASRTPGSLGINDAASPDRPPGLFGDTPGTLGTNDHAAAVSGGRYRTAAPPKETSGRWETFLDSLCNWKALSGPRIAWESAGHREMTSDATRAPFLSQILPTQSARRRLAKVLSTLPNDVVDTDVTLEQFSDSAWGHKLLSQSGQATHFMANKGQSQREAHAAGIEKVFGPAETAVKLFKQTNDDSDLTTRSTSKLDYVSIALGDAVHALQDSFSPAHVQRDRIRDSFVIVRIKVWSEQDKKEHEAGDQSWKDQAVPFKVLRQACTDATLALLSYFVLSVVNKDADAERQKRVLMDKYLSLADRK